MVPDIRTIGFAALVSFREVVRCGGISAAAGHLGIAKSAVSRHIRQLEEYFGVPLFERSGRAVRLTRAGARLHPQIVSLLSEAEMLTETARSEHAEPSGPVRIAATPEFGGVLARSFLPALSEKYPGLQLMLRPSYDFEDLQDPAFDLAFRVGDFRDERLVVREMGRFRRIVVAAPGFFEGAPIHAPEQLSGARCLIFSSRAAESTWRLQYGDDETRRADVAVSGPVAVRSLTTLMQLASDGQGFAFLPDFMLHETLRGDVLRRVLAPWQSRAGPVYLTYRPGAQQITRLRVTIEFARGFVPCLLNGGEEPQ